MSKQISNVVDGETKSSAWGKTNSSFRQNALMTQQFSGLKAKLDNGFSGAIQVISDSTGNENDEWVYKFAEHLASEYPNHNVDYARKPDVDSGDYEARVRVGTGGAGDRNYDFDGSVNAALRWDNSANPFSSSDLEVVFRASIDNFSDGNINCIVGQWGGVGSRRWRILKSSDNNFKILISVDGTNSSTPVQWNPVGTLTNGVPYWFKVTLDADDGSSQHVGTISWKANEGDSWTVGQSTTNAGTKTLFDTDYAFDIGATVGGADENLSGAVYEMSIKDGIDGADLVPRSLDYWNRRTSVFHNHVTIGGSPTLTIWNAAQVGISAKLASEQVSSYSQVGCDCYITSLGYNGAEEVNTLWESYLDTITAYWGEKNIYITSQPSMTSPITQTSIDSAALRSQQAVEYASRNNYGWFDIYREFKDSGTAIGDLVDPDGIHPNDAGMALWSGVVTDTFDGAH